MPRDIPVSNGTLLVNFDRRYILRDIYWPHVGQENHTVGHANRFGVWVDEQFRWVGDEGWQRTIRYEPDTLVSEVTLHHPDLDLRLVCHDLVDFHEDLYVRQVTVHNPQDRVRRVRLFFAHDLHISGHSVGDTAYYEPERRAVLHYKGKRWFMMNVARKVEQFEGRPWKLGVDQWAVGVKEIAGKEGTWRDAEDGTLSGNAVAQGSVDSVLALHLDVPAQGEVIGWYWIAVGKDFQEVTRINRAVRQKGPQTFVERTRYYWALWIDKEKERFKLPDNICQLYQRSLLVLRTQIDHDGAILAANDYDITQFARDTYSYMWPRDGALVAATLVEAGYSEVTRRFFEFCHRVIMPEGYMLHKYNPDGSLASSWHGWYIDGEKQLPVQEDETALVLWALWRHFQHFRDVEFIKPLYRGLIVRAANWLVDYRNPGDGLPRPSWDLWEERRGVLAWTVGATWGGLQAAANFAEAFGEDALAETYRAAADEIRTGTGVHLWSQEKGRFLRMINRREDGGWERDFVIDASMVGLWYFGMFAADHPKIEATMKAIRDRLWIKTSVGGLARYENDGYHQVSQDMDNVPGNPWFVCTLWLGQWYIARAASEQDRRDAFEILQWAAEHALPSGVMAEQVHPYTNAPLSVSPLTWSHATLASTVHQYAHWQNLDVSETQQTK
jgi:GH15 family glucan-1,4-alpha-glucosidase